MLLDGFDCGLGGGHHVDQIDVLRTGQEQSETLTYGRVIVHCDALDLGSHR